MVKSVNKDGSITRMAPTRNDWKSRHGQGRAAPTGVPSDLLSNRPDIREARLLMHAAQCDVEAVRAAFCPRVNITGAVGYQSKSSISV